MQTDCVLYGINLKSMKESKHVLKECKHVFQIRVREEEDSGLCKGQTRSVHLFLRD